MKPPTSDPLKTRPTLLDKIRNLQNENAWYEFVRIYRPLIVRFSIGSKVPPNDAEDIAQNTLAWVADRIVDYEYRPLTCPFRAWLLQKVRHLIHDRFRQIGRKSHALNYDDAAETDAPHSPLEQLPDKSSEWDERWEKEHYRALLDAASQIVRRRESYKKFQAFHMFKIEDQPAELVAQKLGVTTDYVHLASHRIKERLKLEMTRLQKEYY